MISKKLILSSLFLILLIGSMGIGNSMFTDTTMLEDSFETSDLIDRVSKALEDPKKMKLITGKSVKEIREAVTGQAIISDFRETPSKEVLDLAIAAFQRGDYGVANERVKSAQLLLILERKGNITIFFYLYWHFVLIGFLLFSFTGFVSYRKYKKSLMFKRIEDLNDKESNMRKLFVKNQKRYFSGKTSSIDYKHNEEGYQEKLSKLKKTRLTLRNKRVRLLRPEEIQKELKIETMQVEAEIKKIQEKYSNEKTISEKEYKLQFKILNERLAEIESERTTLDLMKKKKTLKGKYVKLKINKIQKK